MPKIARLKCSEDAAMFSMAMILLFSLTLLIMLALLAFFLQDKLPAFMMFAGFLAMGYLGCFGVGALCWCCGCGVSQSRLGVALRKHYTEMSVRYQNNIAPLQDEIDFEKALGENSDGAL